MAGLCKFNETDLDIVPLVVNRELISYTHPIILTQITSPQTSYSSYIQQITSNLVFASGVEIDFLQPNFNVLKSSKMYYLNLSSSTSHESHVSPITVKNQNALPTWAQNFVFNKIIESVRGLVVIYDDPSLIPDVFWTRSILTLTDSTDLPTLRHVLNRAGPGITTIPQLSGSLQPNKLRGCLKGIHWTKIVTH